MAKKLKKYTGLQKRKAISGYLFILPFIIGFLMFMLKPLAQSFYMSFCSVALGGASFDYSWIGWENFYNAFRIDAYYTDLLVDEIVRMMIYSVAILVFSFFISLVLNQKFGGRALVRAVFFLPVILSSGVMLGIESNNALVANLQVAIEDTVSGISITDTLQTILKTTNIAMPVLEKLFEVIDNIYDVAMSSGIQIIIFLSGLQTISASMYEAASIEGCTAWESLWKITFPMISSLFLVGWVYTVVDFCMRSDNELVKRIQEIIIVQELNYGLASAMYWIYLVIIMAFVGLTSFIISKGVYYYD